MDWLFCWCQLNKAEKVSTLSKSKELTYSLILSYYTCMTTQWHPDFTGPHRDFPDVHAGAGNALHPNEPVHSQDGLFQSHRWLVHVSHCHRLLGCCYSHYHWKPLWNESSPSEQICQAQSHPSCMVFTWAKWHQGFHYGTESECCFPDYVPLINYSNVHHLCHFWLF